jgi:AcrR family transcriptional regulator
VYTVHLAVSDYGVRCTLVKRAFLEGLKGNVAGKGDQGEAPPHRVRLSRDRVISAAVVLADQGGLESLSMRNLAQELGVVPMALYKHVANKEELLDGMVDVVFGEVKIRSESAWRTAMRERAISMREALLRHRWAIGLMESGTPGPANLRHHNAVMGCLRDQAHLSFRMAVHAYSVMDSYIYGFALQEKTLAIDIPAEAERRLERVAERHPSPADEYPYLIEVVVELGKSGYDYTEEFEFGLDLLLDGIERLHEEERASGKRRTVRATRR